MQSSKALMNTTVHTAGGAIHWQNPGESYAATDFGVLSPEGTVSPQDGDIDLKAIKSPVVSVDIMDHHRTGSDPNYRPESGNP